MVGEVCRRIVVVIAVAVALGSGAGAPCAAQATGDPTVTVTPQQPVGGSIFAVHGRGFLPGASVWLVPCHLSTDGGPQCVDLAPQGIVAADGTLTALGRAPEPGCGPGGCPYTVLVALGNASQSVEFMVDVIPYTFGGSLSLREPIPLIEGRVSTVLGSGFDPGATVYAQQCSDRGCRASIAASGVSAATVVGPDGSFALAVRLRRVLAGVDCRVGHCWIRVGEDTDALRHATLDLVMGAPGTALLLGYARAVPETIGDACAPLLLTKPLRHPVNVWFHTVDGSAVAGADYVAIDAGQVVIPTGATAVCVPVTIIADDVNEPDEHLSVHIDAVSGARSPAGAQDAYVVILGG
jgi:hypothetical protein